MWRLPRAEIRNAAVRRSADYYDVYSVSVSADDLATFLRQGALPNGWRALYLPSVGSTMDVARDAAHFGAPGRSVFVANHQTAGRGWQGRTWTAPPGFGLLLSVLFRPGENDPPLRYTMLAAVALAEAVDALGLQTRIKWPNDLMLDDRKVAGILAEAFSTDVGLAVVVGCGVNVGLPGNLPQGLPDTAVTLGAALGERPHRGQLLLALLERMEAWLSQPNGQLREAWHARLWGREQTIRAVEAGEPLMGTIAGVGEDGSLTLRLADGTLRRLVSGELLF